MSSSRRSPGLQPPPAWQSFGPPRARPSSGPPRPPFPWIPALYLAGLLTFAARLAYAYHLTRKLVRASTPIPQLADAYESAQIAVPLTVGYLRPKILLPAGWQTWTPEKLEAVLVHERTHVQRADWAIAVLAGVNRCVFWFHPLAWWLEARLKILAEQACDDASLAQVASPECYAQVLVEMAAALRTGKGRVGWEAMAMAKTAEVKMRVERILDEHRPIFPVMTRRRWAAMSVIAVPVIYLAAVARPAHIRAQEAPPQPPAAAGDDLQSARAKLAQLEAELAKFKSEHRGTLPGQVQTDMAQLQMRQLQLAQANAELSQSQQERLLLQAQLQELQRQMANYRGAGNETSDQLDQQIQNLQAQLAASSVTYTPQHPIIKRLGDALEDLRRQTAIAANPDRTKLADLETAVAKIKADLQALNVTIDQRVRQLPEINLALAQQRARLQVLPQLEEFYAQMMRNYAEAHQRVQSLSRATTGPSLLSRRNPEYSETARAAGVQGKVELSVTVGADGAPRDIQVTHSLGHGLDEKAIECVKSWRFRPARHNGEPVTAFIIVEVPFRLQ